MDAHRFVTYRNKAASALYRQADRRLFWLDVELTERCNLDCIHCYINRPAQDEACRKAELGADAVGDILAQAAAMGCLGVRFTGGEPLLREDFTEIYQAARRLGLKVQLFTNGTLLTPSVTRLLARIPPLLPVEITVFGATRPQCAAITRRSGAFDAVCRGIERLRNHKIAFTLKAGPLPATPARCEAFERWAARQDPKSLPLAYTLLLHLRGRNDSPEKNDHLRRLRLSPEAVVLRLARDAAVYRASVARFFSATAPATDGRLFHCGAGQGSGCVDAYGKLQLCTLLRHPETVYDLARGTLEDGVGHFFPAVRRMRAAAAAYLARCNRCFLNTFCEQCPATAAMEHGRLDAPVEYYCRVTHAQARYLGLLAPDEFAWQVCDGPQRLRRLAGEALDRAPASAVAETASCAGRNRWR